MAVVLGALIAAASCSDTPSTVTAEARQSSPAQHSTTAAHSLPPDVGLVSITPTPPLAEIGSGLTCPAHLGNAHDVGNTRTTPSDDLVPRERPTAGVICAYAGLPRRPLELRPVRLSADAAGTLAAALSRVRLGIVTGPVSCPADWGSAALIVFAYRQGPDVTLWYSNSGCATVDNGRVQAGQLANPSFQHFADVFAQVAPSVRCAGVPQPLQSTC